MSDFNVEIYKIREVQDHPFADRLGVYKFEGNDLTVVAGLDNIQPVGTEMIFFPEHSIIPDWILKQNGFWLEEKNRGMLAGGRGNVVKPMKLRKVLSEGVAIPRVQLEPLASAGEEMGLSLAETLNIQKYEAQAKVPNADVKETNGPKVRWDVESAKKYAFLIHPEEDAVATVKYHGSCGIYRVEYDENREIKFSITSKGQGKKGWWLDTEAGGWYANAANKYALKSALSSILQDTPDGQSITVIGEVYGSGVQGEGWKYEVASGDIGFRAFEVLKNDEFYDGDYIRSLGLLQQYNIPVVEVLSRGSHVMGSAEQLAEYPVIETGIGVHEGIVVRPAISRKNQTTGDTLALKFISTGYAAYKQGRPIEEDIS